MSNRKFFSGLPAAMMTRNSQGLDRQQTNFYWPDETDAEEVAPSRSKLRNRSMSTASLMSQASTDTEESRRRKSRQMESKIEFYDMVDVTDNDTESVYSKAFDPTKHKKLETLKSRIEFYDFVEPKSTQIQNNEDDIQSVIERAKKIIPNMPAVENRDSVKLEEFNEKSQFSENNVNGQQQQNSVNETPENVLQSMKDLSLNSMTKNGYSNEYKMDNSKKKAPKYEDSYSESDDDDYYHRNPNRVEERKNYSQAQPRYTPSQRSVYSHPRRYRPEYFEYDDENRFYETTNRRPKQRKPEYIPQGIRTSRRRLLSPEYISDEDFPDYDDFDPRNNSEYLRRRPPTSSERRFPMSSRDRYVEDEPSIRGGSNRRLPSTNNGYEAERQRSNPQSVKISQPADQYESEIDQSQQQAPSTSSRPPVKPIGRPVPFSEAKRRYHINQKSNIFHNDPEYNVMVEQKKPLSVRDFAATSRVGVGLPDFS